MNKPHGLVLWALTMVALSQVAQCSMKAGEVAARPTMERQHIESCTQCKAVCE